MYMYVCLYSMLIQCTTHTRIYIQELNVMQVHKDNGQEMRRRHLASTVELQYQQLRALHETRTDHLNKQHTSEWDNQLSYSKKAERELRKKHVLELKEHPKSLRVRGLLSQTRVYTHFLCSTEIYVSLIVCI